MVVRPPDLHTEEWVGERRLSQGHRTAIGPEQHQASGLPWGHRDELGFRDQGMKVVSTRERGSMKEGGNSDLVLGKATPASSRGVCEHT